MILAAALLDTAGLLPNSPAAIIGAMCVAPFLGSSRAVCISGPFRNRKVFVGGLLKLIVGLLVVGTVTAYIIMPAVEAMDEAIDQVEDEVFGQPGPSLLERIFARKRAWM